MSQISEERMAELEAGAALGPGELIELLAALREARQESRRLAGEVQRWTELAASYQEETAELSSALHKLQKGQK